MNRNPFVAMAVMVAAFQQAMAENLYRDYMTVGGKPRRAGRGAAGEYGRNLRKMFAQKNRARMANGEKGVTCGSSR